MKQNWEGNSGVRRAYGWELEEEMEEYSSYEEGTISGQTKTFKLLILQNENKICTPDFFPRFNELDGGFCFPTF